MGAAVGVAGGATGAAVPQLSGGACPDGHITDSVSQWPLL